MDGVLDDDRELAGLGVRVRAERQRRRRVTRERLRFLQRRRPAVADRRHIVVTQRVEVEAGQVHVLGQGGGIEGVQAPQDAAVHPRVDPRPSGFPKGLQLLARKGLDHRYV